MAGSGQSPAALVLENVTCARGGRVLVSGLSITLGPGDALRVSGPNGSGKSSLLRAIAGLLPLAGGVVQPVGKIALSDERPSLDPEKPLAEALAFWSRIDGGNSADALTQIGMASVADVPVRILSTGQLRRASIARVIAARAEIWLLDEPANGLDSAAQAQLEAAIAAHRQDGGIAVVASHQPIALPNALEVSLA